MFWSNASKLCSGSDVVDNGVEHELLSEAETAWAQREWSIQHVLFPSMRLFFKPPVSMASNGTFVRVMCLCVSVIISNIYWYPAGAYFSFMLCKSHPPYVLSPSPIMYDQNPCCFIFLFVYTMNYFSLFVNHFIKINTDFVLYLVWLILF